MEDLRHVLMVCDTSYFETLSSKSLSVQVSLYLSSSKIPPNGPVARNLNVLSIFLSRHWRTFDFWVLGGPYKTPCTSMTTLSFIDNHQHRPDAPNPAENFPSRSTDCVTTSVTGLAFTGQPLVLGFATGEPSLEVASWPLFDMALCFPIGSERKLLKWLQENIEKLIKLNKRRRWLHSSRVKLSLVNMSASWFLVSTYLILIFGFQVDSVEQSIKRDSVGSGHVSHHSFVIFRDEQLWDSSWKDMLSLVYVVNI